MRCDDGKTDDSNIADVAFDNSINGLVITQLNQKYGVFYEGIELYEPMFDSIGEFKDKRATAKMNGHDYYIFLDKEDELRYYESLHQAPPFRRHPNTNWTINSVK